MVTTFVAATAAAGLAFWVHAQSSSPGPTLDAAAQAELARLEITDPIAFQNQMEQFRTPEDRRIEQLSHLSITDAAAYFAMFPKTAAELQAEARASFSITNPAAAMAEALRTMSTAQKLEMQRAADAILHPPGLGAH